MISSIPLGLRRVLANKTLFVRQLSIQSINTFKNDSQKLIVGQPMASSVCRLSSSAAIDHKSHNHSKLWSLERYVSIGLLAVIPASFMVSHPVLDYVLATSLVTHIHWGLEAIVVDYIRPAIFGKVIPKLMVGYVYLLSVLALSGLFYFNYTDVGLSNAIRMIAKS